MARIIRMLFAKKSSILLCRNPTTLCCDVSLQSQSWLFECLTLLKTLAASSGELHAALRK